MCSPTSLRRSNRTCTRGAEAHLQGTKPLGDIGIKGAWIHNNIKSKDGREHIFGVSKSNKDKMVVLSAPSSDVKLDWIRLLVTCGGIDVDQAAAEQKINPSSVKEG